MVVRGGGRAFFFAVSRYVYLEEFAEVQS